MTRAAPKLALAVQYQTPASFLPRWRLRRWVAHALAQAAPASPTLTGAQLTLRIVDADEAHALNATYRQRDYATNVLTFEYGQDPDGIRHGDIVLCLPVLQREAAEQGKPILHHAAHLVIHGTLHALGYDHQDSDDAHRMETLETALLAHFRIPDPYVT